MSETWIAVIAVAAGLFVLNAVFAYRYRSRQIRSQGQEPPPFLKYLFFPKPLPDRVPMPKPVRVFFGIVIFVGGGLFVAAGVLILANLDLSKLSHPVGAIVMLLLLSALGLVIAYVGVRLMVMKNDDSLLKRTKSAA